MTNDFANAENEDPYFFNQPSMIIDHFGSANGVSLGGGLNPIVGGPGDQSQFLNTQNNKTLQSFLNMNTLNQSKISSGLVN